ncbi:hypothetical protein BIV57_00415 [Mangrovactinospora gilvigrisea]|uniref:Uncharacterized protein n=1 Tax=Mangrovactinospora gilvigrisea TaxID=1428644 RepID=A0A1J7C0U8_9ACTN|nr:hypothetical protein [Mangrovactinospora gilvigrisea]OIV39345.1 hypothetical protein BIV57_00415 [Mangrovactinospora gilvigrisea]
MTDHPAPHALACDLIRTTALDAAARHRSGEADTAELSELRARVTDALEAWQAAGTLQRDVLVLVGRLAIALCSTAFEQYNWDAARFERWLCTFGDLVCADQQHPHPAGPTVMQVVAALAEDITSGTARTAAARRAQIAGPVGAYLRVGHEVEDARELVLVLAQWAGPHLATTLAHDTDLIGSHRLLRDLAGRGDAADEVEPHRSGSFAQLARRTARTLAWTVPCGLAGGLVQALFSSHALAGLGQDLATGLAAALVLSVLVVFARWEPS